MRKNTTNRLVMLSILGAWAFLMRFIDFPLLPSATFLKFDFSDLIALLALWLYGPVGMLSVAFIRDSLNYIIKGGQLGIPIGEVMSILATVSMFLPLHFYYKKVGIRFKWHDALISTIILTSMLILSMSFFNYFIALPWYIKVMNFPIDDIGFFVKTIIIPFNAIKGIGLSLSLTFLGKLLLPRINRKNILFYHFKA